MNSSLASRRRPDPPERVPSPHDRGDHGHTIVVATATAVPVASISNHDSASRHQDRTVLQIPSRPTGGAVWTQTMIDLKTRDVFDDHEDSVNNDSSSNCIPQSSMATATTAAQSSTSSFNLEDEEEWYRRAHNNNSSTHSFYQSDNDLVSDIAEEEEPSQHESNTILGVTVYKPPGRQQVGIGISNCATVDGILVTKIHPDSIFLNTNLQVGMKILRINDTAVSNAFPADYVAMLLREVDGWITLHVMDVRDFLPDDKKNSRLLDLSRPELQWTSVSIYKPHADASVGIGIADRTTVVDNNNTPTTFPVIASFAAGGVYANSSSAKLLRCGMRLLSINGFPCRGRDDAIAMLQIAVGCLEITAGPEDMVFVCSATKEQQSLGLCLQQYDEQTLIEYMTDDSLFADTGLPIPSRILRVNGMEVSGLPLDTLMSILHHTEGTIALLVSTKIK